MFIGETFLLHCTFRFFIIVSTYRLPQARFWLVFGKKTYRQFAFDRSIDHSMLEKSLTAIPTVWMAAESC